MTDMKILVLSDSHHTLSYMQEAVDREQPNQVIHLGDHIRDAEELQRLYPMLPILSIRGNCDHDFASRELVVTEFEGFRFMIAHGHRYGVKNSLLTYVFAAKEAQADVALFGHTHQALCEEYNGLRLLNPGSCGYGARPSYGIIEIKNGSMNCRVEYFE